MSETDSPPHVIIYLIPSSDINKNSDAEGRFGPDPKLESACQIHLKSCWRSSHWRTQWFGYVFEETQIQNVQVQFSTRGCNPVWWYSCFSHENKVHFSSKWVELRCNKILLRMWPSFLRRLRMTMTQSPSSRHPFEILPWSRNPTSPNQSGGNCRYLITLKLSRNVVCSPQTLSKSLEFTQVNSKWRKIFIPSLYNAFFHSNAPFRDFVLGTTKFIRIVQDLVNRVYPEVNYTIRRDDPIHLLMSSDYNLHVLY